MEIVKERKREGGEIVREIERIERDESPDARCELARSLHDVLARTQLLLMKTQVFYWNAAGAGLAEFQAATRMQFRDLSVAADVLAERMHALGFPSAMSFSDLLSRAEWLDKYPPPSVAAMIGELLGEHREIARRLRKSIEAAVADGDSGTEELLSARLINHQDAIRILRSVSAAHD